MKRFLSVVLLGAFVCAAIPAAAVAGLSVRTYPYRPCNGDEVSLLVAATECDVLFSARRPESGPIRVRRIRDERAVCDPPAFLTSTPVSIGQLAAGTHTLVIEDVLVIIRPDGSVDSTTSLFNQTFFVALDCPPPPGPIDDLPYVDRWAMRPDRLCATEPIGLALAGSFPGLGMIQEVAVVDREHVSIVLGTHGPNLPDSTAWSHLFTLGSFPAGSHRVNVELVTIDGRIVGVPGPPVSYGVGSFEVESCDQPPPPPPPGHLPYVSSIRVTAARNDQGPICPDDSIRVTLAGEFPSDCYVVRALRLLPSPVLTPLPAPPIVELVIDDRACLDIACTARVVPWRASITMPPLPSLRIPYQLMVHAGVTTCADSFPPESLHVAIVPFRVAPADSCRPDPFPCFFTTWDHSSSTRCDAFIGPGRRAAVHFAIATPVDLAGLQGRFELHAATPPNEPPPSGLRIVNIEPEGPAAGMRLTWEATPSGARFVLFGKGGAVIPANDRNAENFLRLTLAAPPNTAPRLTHVSAGELLGSDVSGAAVRPCPIRTLVWDVATICPDPACDANQDGITDVRDLVLMLRCLRGVGACPDSAVFDCTADGLLNLDDVLCCARRVLIDGCRNCPPDTIRPEPGVAVRFGAPSSTIEGGLVVPLVISGLDRLASTTLRIAYPDRRFVVSGVFVDDPSWIEMHEVRNGELILGLLRTGPEAGPQELALRFELAPVAGQSSGGEVRVLGAEFSGTDGVRLSVSGAMPVLRLGATGVELSAAMPNPTSGETRFTLALDAEVRVDVAVHDVAGRRVATLARGTMPAGDHVLTWDGRGGGGRLGEGVYFVRAVVDGRVLSRRLVLLGSR